MMLVMTRRLLSPDVRSQTLQHSPLGGDEVLQGAPTTGATTLDALGEVEVGIWEMTSGTARDVEVDEVFVVLEGAGTVSFEDGERLALAPGVAVRLRAGDHTEWTITRPLRKVWVAR
jgi:uncharacterized cupin superfamily protein